MYPPVGTFLHCVVMSLLVAFLLKPYLTFIKGDTYLCVIHLLLGYIQQ